VSAFHRYATLPCNTDLGLTKGPGERFALWALLYTLGRGLISMSHLRAKSYGGRKWRIASLTTKNSSDSEGFRCPTRPATNNRHLRYPRIRPRAVTLLTLDGQAGRPKSKL
jgi:hypothetical protein